MRRFGVSVLLAILVSAAGGLPLATAPGQRAEAQVAAGRILAPANRQVAWLDLEAPRPRLVTHFDQPAYVTGVATSPTAPVAALALSRNEPDTGAFGSDLLSVDLVSEQVSPLVIRGDRFESLASPVWWFDGSGIVFERQDLSVPATGFRGTATVLYPTRIEAAQADGSGRTVLVDSGRQPAPSPDGRSVALLRTSDAGTTLVVRSLVDGTELTLVPLGPFADLASPRYSPRGDTLAFMAPGQFVGRAAPPLLPSAFFGLTVAFAHGLPWDLWLVGADGSNMHRLAELGADDGTVTWSPDASQLFVYGGTGSFLVDAVTGETTALPYVAGYGSTAWLGGAQ